MKYYITSSADYVVYQEPEPDDEWDRGHDGYENHTFDVKTEKITCPDRTFETDMKYPHFIAVIYSGGCSFGRTDGNVDYMGPFTKEEADENLKRLQESDGSDYIGICDCPMWRGYFEHYQDAQIITVY